MKPFKLAVSFGLYAFVLAWMLSLSTRVRRTGAGRGHLLAGGATILVLWLATAGSPWWCSCASAAWSRPAWAIRLGLVVGLVGMALGMLMIGSGAPPATPA